MPAKKKTGKDFAVPLIGNTTSARIARTRKYLDAQPKETMMMPKAAGEVGTQEVNYNGCKFSVPLGVRVEMPKPIADLLYAKLFSEQRLVDASVEAVIKMEQQ